jgi:dihydroorotase
MKKILIHNAHLVDAFTDRKNSALLLQDEKILSLPSAEKTAELLADGSVEKIDARNCVVMPSFIDLHAHFRDPGFTQKEDLESGSRAMASGGFSRCVLMPNTNPVISSAEAAEKNVARFDEFGRGKIFQAVSITENFDGKTLSHLQKIDVKKIPVISEDGKEVRDSSVMFSAMKIAAEKNLIVACHSEDPFLAEEAKKFRVRALEFLKQKKTGDAAEFLLKADSLLELAEDTATSRNLRLAQEAHCRIHVCHVSTARCVEEIKNARAHGTDVTFEITPHHLFLSGGKIPEIFCIVNPPLRSEKNRLALVQSLLEKSADCISTDHAPHTADDKKNGSPGFSGLETAFASCNTALVKNSGMKLTELSALMSLNPARILGVENEGLLREGFFANIVVADPEKKWTVCGEKFFSRGKYSALEGKEISGEIKTVLFRGKIVFEKNSVF